ncbi:hypothetical protein GPECTOR_69g442 [Gonium pectorale]|uniref:phytol kinase n=1 Tax=Gonium pectorale TaxID=33097 RepID=A0A150G394_GONPE|nr:hypothetical protein GPECTOR_69g442 [Gonium pectorale]|eukprot:KXZ44349.1 hypothetical protein GPECTOR_69g442 [Gonium pectorale]
MAGLAETAWSSSSKRPDRQLAMELARALAESAALQHTCRVLLLLAPRAPALASSDILRLAAPAVGLALANLHHLVNVCADQDPTSATLLYGVASDRCVQTAALAMGVAELCTADGGPAYGMPPELLRGLTALFGSGGSDGGSGDADSSSSGGIEGPRSDRDQSQAAGVQYAFYEVAYAARFLLRLRPGSGPAAVAEAAELWRLLGLGLRWWRVWSEKDQEVAGRDLSNWMTMLVDACIVNGLHDPTLEPPPSFAAALAGGVLPLTEMLLRRAEGEDVPAEITRGLLGGGTFAASAFLAPLLAYGEPHQAAALVATVGKVLALTDPRVVTASVWKATQQCVVNAACDLLAWGLHWWEETAADAADAAAAVGPSAAPPLRQRVARVLSCAACAWLPALSGLLFSAIQALASAAKEGSGSSPPPDRKASAAGAFTLMEAVLPWLPLLARARELRTAAAGSGGASRGGSGSGDVRSEGKAGGGGGGDGSSSSGDGGDCEGGGDGAWRELIETCAPALRSLGCSLRLAAAAPPGGVPVGALRGLVAACRLVESWPHEPWATEDDGAPLQASWPPGALGAVAEQLRAADSLDPAATAERLAASLTRRRPGTEAVTSAGPAANVPVGGTGGGRQSAGEAIAGHIEEEEEEGHGGRRAAHGRSLAVPLESLARSMLPPSESRRAMRSCGNPACTVLRGDSEAEQPPLKACAGCGAVGSAELLRLKRQLSASSNALAALKNGGAGDAMAIKLLSGERLGLTLLRLVLSAMRAALGSALGADAERAETTAEVVSSSLELVLWALNRALPRDKSNLAVQRAARGFMRRLLRTQALQAAGRSLAAVGGGGGASGVAPSETNAASEVGAAPASEHVGYFDGALCKGSPADVVAVSIAAFVIRTAFDAGDLACSTSSSTQPNRQLAAELARGLADSAALQHACRVLLLLAPRNTAALAGSCVLQRAATEVGQALSCIHDLGERCAKQDPASAALLHGVTCDRCVQTAALAVGLAELCAADGGPAYGMPPGLLRGLTALFGVSSAEGQAAAGTRRPRLLLESSEVFFEFLCAAQCLLRLPPESGPAAVAEAAELWRLIGLRVWMRRVWSEEAAIWCRKLSYRMKTLAGRCIVAAETGLNGLTPEPPPSLAAALAGGVLPLTEMLLRRAIVGEHVPAAITRGLLGGSAFAASAFLAPLLAYGEPHQAAALVATVGKVLALTDPRVVIAAAWEPQEDTQQCVVNAACDLLVWGLHWWEETAANDANSYASAAAAGPSAAPSVRQRLARILSCAACAWLPALSGLLSSAVQALAPAAKEESSGSSPPPDGNASTAGAFTLLGAVLPWLPLLARARELRTAAAGSGAASRGGSGSGDVRSGGKAGCLSAR